MSIRERDMHDNPNSFKHLAKALQDTLQREFDESDSVSIMIYCPCVTHQRAWLVRNSADVMPLADIDFMSFISFEGQMKIDLVHYTN